MSQHKKDCENCGGECYRDDVHNGVCVLYGPWMCPACGWSEDERYDTRDKKPVKQASNYIPE